MKTYHFNKEKYKNGILMDLGSNKEIPQYNFSDQLHTTTFFEIIVVNEGKGKLLLDTHSINFDKGFFIFISPNQKRKWKIISENMKIDFIIFEQDFLNDFFADKYFIYRLQYFFSKQIPPYFRPNYRMFSFENDIFEEIKTELRNSQKDSAHLLRSILYYILIKLNREFSAFHHINQQTHENEIAITFKNLLQENILQLQQVNDYCKILKTSRITLNSSVKKQFGITASEMIHNYLIYEIKDQILHSNKTISEIAFLFNFKEPQHLNRFFKRYTKTTPLQFKEVYQNGYI